MSRAAMAETGAVIDCPCCGEKGKKAPKYALRMECFKAMKKSYNKNYKKAKRPNNERKDELLKNWRDKQSWAYSLSERFLKLPMRII